MVFRDRPIKMKPEDWKYSQFFTPEEFQSPDLRDSGLYMIPEFMDKILLYRIFMDEPMSPTSGFRTYGHNKKVGGIASSYHLIGGATDWACEDSVKRHKMIKCAIAADIKRIGINNTANFLHYDFGVELGKSKEEKIFIY